MVADPKKIRIRLTPAGRAALKKKLYLGRANRHCENIKCGVFCTWQTWWMTDAQLSHNRHGSNKEDTEEGCKIECPKCHDKKHRGLK